MFDLDSRVCIEEEIEGGPFQCNLLNISIAVHLSECSARAPESVSKIVRSSLGIGHILSKWLKEQIVSCIHFWLK